MTIEFCDNCGKILRTTIEGEKIIGTCTCGFIKEINLGVGSTEKMKKKGKIGEGVLQEFKTAGFPHTCAKCGHDECDVVDLGAQVSDESNIYLYKCKKCGYVERQADGTGNT